MKEQGEIGRILLWCVFGTVCLHFCVLTLNAATTPLSPKQKAVVAAAEALLETSDASYAYGGSRIGEGKDCELCNQCLSEKRPVAKQRLSQCPICSDCSIDCSHFTQLVYKNAGLDMPYLDTATMLALSPDALLRRYKLVHIAGSSAARAQVGDLLVYEGHVVLVTSLESIGRGDIIHATGGKDIREPGQGIQRERNVPLESFRGRLLRVLRHKNLYNAPTHKLRPVIKK